MRRIPAAALAALLSLAACDPFDTRFDDVEDARSYRAARLTEPRTVPGDTLRVMTWNVKFGGGRVDFFYDCHGDAVLMDEATVYEHLDALAAKIRQVDPDVLMLQEVDVESKRSGYVDQLQVLLDQTRLNFAVYASQWKADFVPSDGLGRMDDGIAILSRWPLRDARRIALPQRTDQSGVERYFYLKRAILRARLDLPGDDDVYVVNTHLEAFSADDTKLRQLHVLQEELAALDAAGERFVLGADLNTVPPGTARRSGFDDKACPDDSEFDATDFTREEGWVDPLYAAYHEAIPLAAYRADNRPYFTHTTDGDGFWNRKIDYLFTNGRWLPGSGLTHQDAASGGMETMPLSDHAPITATLDLTR